MKSRKKAYQVSDVIAALQYGRETLVKTIRQHNCSKPVEFHLAPSGVEIGPRVAEKALNTDGVVGVNDGLFAGESQQFVWQG